MIRGLYEAHLPVRNLKVSIPFYESLGLKLYKRGNNVPLDTTLLQTYTHENMIGKVFSFHYSIYGSLIQLSMFFTGGLLEILSPQMIGCLLATCCIFVSFIWLFLFYRGDLSE